MIHEDEGSVTLTGFREQELVDDNVMGINLVLRQFLDEALGLV